jgi:hypothetical protein
VANGYCDNFTIDRINANGDYTPDNCRWVTTQVQNKNKRNNCVLTYNNTTNCLCDWAKRTDVTAEAIHKRLMRGLSVEQALTLPRYYDRRSQNIFRDTSLNKHRLYLDENTGEKTILEHPTASVNAEKEEGI